MRRDSATTSPKVDLELYRGPPTARSRLRQTASRCLGPWCLLALTLSLLPGAAQVGPAAGGELWDESVLWWTLTDRVSPQQLEASSSDRRAVLSRYLEALERGLAPALFEEELDSLTTFHQGLLSPELLPLWKAVDLLFLTLDVEAESQRFSELATSYGISARARQAILAATPGHRATCEDLVEQGPANEALLEELVATASFRTGREYRAEQLSVEDVQAVASATGREVQTILDLERQHRLGPRAVCSIPTVMALHGRLSQPDWTGFRALLLRDVARRVSTMGYEAEGE